MMWLSFMYQSLVLLQYITTWNTTSWMLSISVGCWPACCWWWREKRIVFKVCDYQWGTRHHRDQRNTDTAALGCCYIAHGRDRQMKLSWISLMVNNICWWCLMLIDPTAITTTTTEIISFTTIIIYYYYWTLKTRTHVVVVEKIK